MVLLRSYSLSIVGMNLISALTRSIESERVPAAACQLRAPTGKERLTGETTVERRAGTVRVRVGAVLHRSVPGDPALQDERVGRTRTVHLVGMIEDCRIISIDQSAARRK